MANIVWHKKLRILLDLTQDDLDHPELPGLWETVYTTDRYYGRLGVPVHERDLLCGGVCRDAGAEASMHLRVRNGRREAVHERSEDEQRHNVPMSDEHKAYQERILRAAQQGGFHGDSEVRTRAGRSWIQTDTLVEGADGRRIGWEVQLSTIDANGLRGVRARASKAAKNGITPAWHTDRAAYAQRNDAHWTRSDHLPAYVIARTGDLRIVSGFRKIDFWRCGSRAVHPCPGGAGRCGKAHATPVPKDILFDDMVRATAAGTIVPIQFRAGTKIHRFWVTSTDHAHYSDLLSDDTQLRPVDEEGAAPTTASRNRPTCRPRLLPAPPDTASAAQDAVTLSPQVPRQPSAAILEAPAEAAVSWHPPAQAEQAPQPDADAAPGLPQTLIRLQLAADAERSRLSQLNDDEERRQQRLMWFEAASTVQAAVTDYARAKRLNRFEVQSELRRLVQDRKAKTSA